MLGNRKGLPPSFKMKKKETKGTIESFRSKNILALSWYDKRRVLMLSTKHSNNAVTATSRFVYLTVIFHFPLSVKHIIRKSKYSISELR